MKIGGFIVHHKNSLNGYNQMQQGWINSNVLLNLCSSVVILVRPDFKDFISPQYVSAFDKNHNIKI